MKQVALITGAAKRIGAQIAKKLHAEGIDVIIHYHYSKDEAQNLVQELNTIRPHSASAISGELTRQADCHRLIERSHAIWQGLDILVNNASSFYPTPVSQATEDDWENLIGSNVKGPFFLSQAAAPYLKEHQGVIINIVDIHADRPLKNYPIYCIAKAGLAMLTRSLARELAPEIRVNGVAPGVIMWPEGSNKLSPAAQQDLLNRTCLKREGNPEDIAETVYFLIKQDYISGQIIAVDGGRSIKD